MAILLPTANAIFYEIPKTGTTWVRAALADSGVRYIEAMPRHGLPCEYCGHFDLAAATLRQPDAWLESYWKVFLRKPDFWERNTWPLHRLFPDRQPRSFAALVAWIIRYRPALVSEIFAAYCGVPGAPLVDAVMRQERLSADLAGILGGLGYDVGRARLERTPRQNVAPADGGGGLEWGGLRDRFLAGCGETALSGSSIRGLRVQVPSASL